jgi:hypothetical protein
MHAHRYPGKGGGGWGVSARTFVPPRGLGRVLTYIEDAGETSEVAMSATAFHWPSDSFWYVVT